MLLALATVVNGAAAQDVEFGSPSTGSYGLSAFPWGVTGGLTTLHVYRASYLRLWGVCTGAQLVDFAVASGTAGNGTFFAPQCTLAIGHLLVDPPVPGAWTSHLDAPNVVHDLAAGPFTFPWTQGIWNPLPGVANAGFVWDGVRDIGVVLSTSPQTTGTFATATSAGPRHSAQVFGATTQVPVVLSGYSMAARMTFLPNSPCAKRPSSAWAATTGPTRSSSPSAAQPSSTCKARQSVRARWWALPSFPASRSAMVRAPGSHRAARRCSTTGRRRDRCRTTA